MSRHQLQRKYPLGRLPVLLVLSMRYKAEDIGSQAHTASTLLTQDLLYSILLHRTSMNYLQPQKRNFRADIQLVLLQDPDNNVLEGR